MIIRKYNSNDEKAIINICFETRGDYLEDLKDPYIFSLRWAQCYLRYYPEYCFVAEENEEVIGYILSTPNTLEEEKLFVDNILPEIKSKVDQNSPFYSELAIFKSAKVLTGDIVINYPAHLHINLTSKCRHKGIGTKLMIAMEENLKKNGVNKIHLGVMADNINAVSFYKKHGYITKKEHDFGEGNIGLIMTKNIQ